jgi:molecular chaperone HtpG
VLHVSEDSKEYLEDAKISELLNKYCKFLPVEIKFGTKEITKTEGKAEDKKDLKEVVDNIINNPNPLWKKKPNDLTEDHYRDFYNELYPYSQPPLFWIHLNIDFPFNLTGILYFPKVNNSLEVQKNKIQLYSNQVYVTDEVKDIVPEFLTLLHGVIDSPDIPLNVSRSYLQADSNVKKITSYITKKVAEKLASIFKEDRQLFEQRWDETGVFVKYGMISNEKFNDKAQEFALLKNTDGEYFTIDEYKEKIKGNQTDKYDKVVCIYANNNTEQYTYIQEAKEAGYDVLLLDNVIDNHFIQHLEYKEDGLTFVRVDSDTTDNLVQKDEQNESVLSEEEQEKVKSLFTEVLTDLKGGSIELKNLNPNQAPVMITRPEFMRRMKEMQMMQGMQMGDFPDAHNVIVNTNHPFIAKKLLKKKKKGQQEAIEYLHNLAMLNQNMLKGEDLARFISKSMDMVTA